MRLVKCPKCGLNDYARRWIHGMPGLRAVCACGYILTTEDLVRVKKPPKFEAGDTIRYKAGKQGFHYGFTQGDTFLCLSLTSPHGVSTSEKPNVWNGWWAEIKGEGGQITRYPAGWFEKAWCRI